MKLGFGLYRHMLNREELRFAVQCGATHLVVHYVDYFNQSDGRNPRGDQPTGGLHGWGCAGDPENLWSVGELTELRQLVESEGLVLYAIENFDPAHWHDVLLDGPRKPEQLENLKTIIRNVGAAGIHHFGYNFSLAGVYGRQKGAFARGGAESVGLSGPMDHTPMPKGMVWNMTYNPELAGAPGAEPDSRALCTHEELWSRLNDFLEAVVPAAEAAGVVLAAHPDDPPLPTVRGTPPSRLSAPHVSTPSRRKTKPEQWLGILSRHPGRNERGKSL